MPDAERTQTVTGERLKQFIERIESLEEEKAEVAAQIKEVYGEAKGEGYDTKVMRSLIRLRKQEPAEREEAEALLDLYARAIGGL